MRIMNLLWLFLANYGCITSLLILLPCEGFSLSHQKSHNIISTPKKQALLRFPIANQPIITTTTTKRTNNASSLRQSAVSTNNDSDTSSSMTDTMSHEQKKVSLRRFYRVPKKAYQIYTNYAKQLWTETNVDARKKIANDKVRGAIRNMQHILTSDEYAEFSTGCETVKGKLLANCHEMLETLQEASQFNETIMKNNNNGDINTAAAADVKDPSQSSVPTKKKRRSILFGAVMGAVVACWVFSGNYLFTGLFTLMTILGQLEYYRMVISTGVYPARRISVLGACSMFLTALFMPELHQLCLPAFGLYSMIWFLTMRRQVTSIPEIATTFTGMFYLGYVPSFWVRLRLVDKLRQPTRLAPLAGPVISYLNQKFGVRMPTNMFYSPVTTGAVFIFWTWLSLAFSDVGAYFVGRAFGKTKLGAVAPAAGVTSPNKTVEGVIGGCAVSAALSILGAWIQKWPYFFWTGALHGLLLGLIGLIGDLTASMLKRDAGIKDFGDLIPEHGGILDRVDSFVWAAPYSFLVCAYIIPLLRTISGR